MRGVMRDWHYKMGQRVIVFGSRDWPDRDAVVLALYECCNDMATIVHGACPTGADAFAAGWPNDERDRPEWQVLGVKHEAHPADWDKHGKAAGPIRNQEMVDAGADFALGFICGTESRGSEDMLRRLRKAGIETVVFYMPKGGA